MMSMGQQALCIGLFAVLTALAGSVPVSHINSQAIVKPSSRMQAVPFAISRVTLANGSLFAYAQQRNHDFQLSLDNDQLLCEFKSAANLTSCIKSDGSACATPGVGSTVCNPLPGEMGPGGYYGHYLGHYLSGMAMMWNNTQDERIKAKANIIVQGLKDVQDAWDAKGAPGYIFPYYPVVFGIMERRCGRNEPDVSYSVPYYTLHKVMAGLLDQYTMAGNEDAFNMVCKLADWVVGRVDLTFKRGGEQLWQCVLNTEWGGMNEVLYNLYAVTGKMSYYTTGLRFNHWQFTAPLAIGVDDLDASHGNVGGNHANTHIPEIIGSARGYEVSGNSTQKAITENFFNIITAHHSWATGGSNDGEHWTTPDRMGDQLNGDTEESCTQYNILKVTRHLFEWTASARYADFYERAILNGIIGNQNKLDPTMTSFIYMLPLGAGGMKKPWGASNVSFPCCWGTLTEQLSKLSDSIYFATQDHSAIFVNQFIASSIHWMEQGAVISQDTTFPVNPTTTTTISVEVIKPNSEFDIKIRVPAWSNGASSSVLLNGKAVSGIVEGSYLTISRKWNSGDKVECYFPMTLWASLVQDNRTIYNETMAWMYGPLVLAGLTDNEHISPAGKARSPETFISRNSSTALSFEAKGRDYKGSLVTFQMIPLYQVMEESYSVYFRTSGYSEVRYSPNGAQVPSLTNADYEFNSASIVPSRLPGLSDLRTANPGCTSTLTLAHPILGEGHKIETVSFSYRYVAGYDSTNGTWPIMSASLIDAETQKSLGTFYTSPSLDKYRYDDFKGYSPLIHVSQSNLNVDNSNALFLQFTIVNNDHNLQIPLLEPDGLDISIKWAAGKNQFTHSQYFVREPLDSPMYNQ